MFRVCSLVLTPEQSGVAERSQLVSVTDSPYCTLVLFTGTSCRSSMATCLWRSVRSVAGTYVVVYLHILPFFPQPTEASSLMPRASSPPVCDCFSMCKTNGVIILKDLDG